MPSSRRIFECGDCGGAPNCPMLLDDTWRSAAGDLDLLCVSCTERRMGRGIGIADLQPCAGNDWMVAFLHQNTGLNYDGYQAKHRVARILRGDFSADEFDREQTGTSN